MLSKIWIALTAITALAHAAAINRLSPREQELDRALFKRQSVTQRKGTDIQILNFALALELIDISLFTGGLANFTQQDFLRAGFPIATRAEVEQVASDERAHAAFIQNAIITAGGTPIQPCQYQFPYTDVKSFIALGSIIEGVGSSAYIGSLAAFKDPQYATGAGGILGVEVRHNALLRALNGENPNSAPFDTPLSAQAVTSLAAGFYVPGSCPNGSALPFSPFPALNLTTNTRLVPGANIDVSPANSSTGSVADNSTLTNGTVFCAFASGLSVGYSTWGNGSCTIPTSNVTAGQTYLALTSTQSITDDSVIAGMAVLNIVDAKVPPLTSIFPNITAAASRSCSKTSTPSQTSTPFAPSSSPVSQTA